MLNPYFLRFKIFNWNSIHFSLVAKSLSVRYRRIYYSLGWMLNLRICRFWLRTQYIVRTQFDCNIPWLFAIRIFTIKLLLSNDCVRECLSWYRGKCSSFTLCSGAEAGRNFGVIEVRKLLKTQLWFGFSTEFLRTRNRYDGLQTFPVLLSIRFKFLQTDNASTYNFILTNVANYISKLYRIKV